MFSNIKRIIGEISVEEKGGQVIIEGLPANVFLTDIWKHWGTSKIEEWMFTDIGRSRVTFNSFYLVEVLYMLRVLHDKHGHKQNYRAVEKIIQLIHQNTSIGQQLVATSEDILDFNQIHQFTMTPLDMQMQFLKLYNQNVVRYRLNGYLLGSKPGTGKTIASMMLAECLKKERKIIVCPMKSVHQVWEASAKTAYKVPRTCWTADSGKPPTGDEEYLIVYYEALEDFYAMLKKNHKLLQQFKNAFIAVDECHNFNNLESLRTGLLLKMIDLVDTDSTLFLSGTAIKAVGSEAATMLRVITSDFNEDAEKRFMKIFGKSAARANDILNHRLGLMKFISESTVKTPSERIISVSIPNGDRYTLEMVREDMRAFIRERAAFYQLNEKQYVDTYLECLQIHFRSLISEEQKREFIKYRTNADAIRYHYDPSTMKEIVKNCNLYEKNRIMPTLDRERAKAFKDARSVYKYVSLKIMGEALGRVLTRIRVQCHVDMVDHIDFASVIENAKKKTLIFTSYVEVVDRVFDRLTKEGFKPIRIYADTNKHLDKLIDSFKRDEDVNPLIATYKSLSESVPLIEANTLMALNAPFRDHEWQQTVARIARTGQDTETDVMQFLLNTGTKANISTRSKEIMDWSKQQAEEILGVKTTSDTDISLENHFIDVDAPNLDQAVFMGMLPSDIVVQTEDEVEQSKALPKFLMAW